MSMGPSIPPVALANNNQTVTVCTSLSLIIISIRLDLTQNIIRSSCKHPVHDAVDHLAFPGRLPKPGQP